MFELDIVFLMCVVDVVVDLDVAVYVVVDVAVDGSVLCVDLC